MKVSVLLALVASTSAITLTNPRVDAHNWPGTILAGDRAIMPVTSSFVDDDFDPMFNKFRYGGSLAQLKADQRHNVRQELSSQLRSALVQENDIVPGDIQFIQLEGKEICETVECARQ